MKDKKMKEESHQSFTTASVITRISGAIFNNGNIRQSEEQKRWSGLSTISIDETLTIDGKPSIFKNCWNPQSLMLKFIDCCYFATSIPFRIKFDRITQTFSVHRSPLQTV